MGRPEKFLFQIGEPSFPNLLSSDEGLPRCVVRRKHLVPGRKLRMTLLKLLPKSLCVTTIQHHDAKLR